MVHPEVNVFPSCKPLKQVTCSQNTTVEQALVRESRSEKDREVKGKEQ